MNRSILYLLILSLPACRDTPMTFTISHQKVQEGLPSSSGIVKHNGSFYAIGDDSPLLFQLDNDFEIINQYPIFSIPGDPEQSRMAKKDKPDLEALERVGENEIIAFGSGSKSPERDDFIKIIFEDTVIIKKYRLTTFYNVLKSLEIMEDSELNIEAVAYGNDVLYLFNRRKNIIFNVNYKEFISFIINGSALPEIGFSEFKLPEIDGIEAGFSGGTVYNGILFITASVENTPNAYDDGEILGSFIGKAVIEDSGIGETKWAPIKNNGKPLKVESISINRKIAERDIEVVITTDSDGGHSLFLKGRLRW